MAKEDQLDQSPQPPNPIIIKRSQAFSSVVAYSFGHDASTIGHIEYSKGEGDESLINSEGNEVVVHFPIQS